MRASDVAARFGGEEFVVLLPSTDAAAASRLAERIRRAVSAEPVELPNGETTTITASIGIAEVSPKPGDKDLKTLGDSLIARADVALYAAKHAVGKVPRPHYWSGFRVRPRLIEFWQDGAFRLHDRLVYHRDGDAWRTERLFP